MLISAAILVLVEQPRAELKLRNGSLIKGSIAAPPAALELKTRYATMKIPIADVSSIAWGDVVKEERDTVVTREGTYSGYLEGGISTIEVDTGFGVLKIPVAQIRTLRLWSGKALGDDFESGSLDKWTKHGLAQRSVSGGELTVTGSGGYDILVFNEELDGPYAFEVDLSGNAGSFGVAWHLENQTSGVGLWVYQNQVAVYGGGTWYSSQLASLPAAVNPAERNHLRIEVERHKATVYWNDSKLGTVHTPPVQRGKVGLFSSSGQATFARFQIFR